MSYYTCVISLLLKSFITLLHCVYCDKYTFYIDEEVAVVLMKKITDAFELFASNMLKKMEINPKLASLPIEVCICYFIDISKLIFVTS